MSKVNNDSLLDRYYVWFKNNCPAVGPLYDDIRFEPFDESLRNKLHFVVDIDDKRSKFKYGVITARNNYNIEFGGNSVDWLVDFLNKWGIEA